jgi:hypothetical protein
MAGRRDFFGMGFLMVGYLDVGVRLRLTPTYVSFLLCMIFLAHA